MKDGVFDSMTGWPAGHASAAAFTATALLAGAGDLDAAFELASVTKVLTATGCLVAAEELAVDVDEPLVDSASLADLLAHSSGMHPSDRAVRLAVPGTRRIYSNAGYEQAAASIEQLAGLDFSSYLEEGIFGPLGLTETYLRSSPAHGAVASVRDLVTFVQALLTGRLLAGPTLDRMLTPHRPELVGVLPGYGKQEPNQWGLGPEIRGRKSPHWTSSTNSAETWGHFGQAGTFLWFDPTLGLGCIVLTDEPFGPWALERWPRVSADVVARFGERR